MSAKAAKVVIWVFGLLGWLIVYLADKTQLQDDGVKLYLNEMIILTIANAAAVILAIVIIGGLLGLAAMVFWVWGLVYIIQDKDEPLPLIGNWRLIK
ncbi:MAG: hypothetical protein IJ336_04010 [Lachnospiraceae bacterium]|nr:hypothetical protein [Lachnospiraceae bacterium]MBQ7832726.1 hypothetical protein [Lachnospiraceae bacterium]